MKEIWKEIPNTKGYYKVSDIGNVYSVRSKKLIDKNVHRNGYVSVWLGVDGKSMTPSLHRLVAEAFVPNPENKPCVNHIDGNKQNNRADNLEWVTHSENMRHAEQTRLQGHSNWHCKHQLYYDDVCMTFNTIKELQQFLNIGIDRIKYTKKYNTIIGIGEYALYKIRTINA